MKAWFGGIAILLALGCDPMMVPPQTKTYMAWEEGLTLGYIKPHLPASQQERERTQFRVAHSQDSPKGREVSMTVTTLEGQKQVSYVLRGGGLLLGTPSHPEGVLLPEGFPEKAQAWESLGMRSRWIGYGSAPLETPLPKGPREPGIWVESLLPDGGMQRALYVPNIGPVEVLEWQQGRWVSILRLVSRGFTDVPHGK